MADQPIKYNSQIEKDEHDDSANIGGKRVILFAWNANTLAYERVLSSSGVLQTSGAGGGGSTTVTYNSTPPTLTNTQTAPLQGDSSGNLKVNVVAGGAGGGAATVADGADVAEGATTDVAVVGDNTGTVSAKLRGLNKNVASALTDLDTIVTNTNKIISAPATSANQATIITSVQSIDTKTPALGQALAAASVPVILPSATITTLTPPTNTGYALDSSLADVATIGAKTDAKSAATDITSVSAMSVLKQISASVQAPPSQAVTNAGTFAVQAAESDGANVTLGAKADAKSTATDTTAVTAMSVLKQISASVQAPPSQAVTNAGTFAVQATPVTQADTFMLGGVNVKEINGVTPLMGAGNGGTGSLRVNIASDQVSIPVAATLSAETTKVIGTVNMAASQTIGIATGANTIGAVTQSGTWTIATNADAAIGAGTAPAKALITGGVYNTSAPAPTNGQSMALQADQAGNLRIFPGVALAALSAWNSSTALNATQNIFTNSGCPAVLIQLDQTTTITAGAITFEVTYDGTNWVTITASQVVDPTSSSYAQLSLPYTLQASTNKAFIISNNGWQGLRIKLSTQITGTGAVTPNYALLPFDPVDSVIAYSPTAANFNVTVGGSLPAGTNVIGALSANQSTNVAQINAVAPLMGNGITGTGSQRITVASDNTAVANWGQGATGSAVPSGAQYSGGQARSSEQTAVSNTQLIGLITDLVGKLIVLPYANPENFVNGTTGAIVDTTSTSTIAAQGAGVRTYITTIIVTNSHATVGTFVKILDGATIIAEGYAAAAGGGFVATFPTPLRGTANTAVNTQCVTTGANVIATVAGYKGI